MEKISEKNYTITADDYGIRQSAQPILALVDQGLIDRVSVMIRFVSLEDAQMLLTKKVKIDLHLELIDMLQSGNKMHDSAMKRGLSFVFRYGFGFVTAKKVEEEWQKQIESFREKFGRLPDGLNSHEHIHYFPIFFDLCTKLARAYHIPFVRFGQKGFLQEQYPSFAGKILSLFSQKNRRIFAKTHLDTTQYVVSLDWVREPQNFLQTLPKQDVTEIVVHPERQEEYERIQKYF